MEFRLTYAGKLLAHRGGRSLHIHAIRQVFHQQLKSLWNEHPVLYRDPSSGDTDPDPESLWEKTFPQNGYNWKPIVTKSNGLICALDILMLRKGLPGRVQTDIDNRLKTVFDALRMPASAEVSIKTTCEEDRSLKPEQDPFFVLLEDDQLITRVSITSDMLLEPVAEVTRPEDAVRLVINVNIRPYRVTWLGLGFVGG